MVLIPSHLWSCDFNLYNLYRSKIVKLKLTSVENIGKGGAEFSKELTVLTEDFIHPT